MTVLDSPTATAAARRLLSGAIPEQCSPDAVAADMDQVFAHLFHTLSQWVGTAGCQALFARALVLSAPNRPVLTGVLYRPHTVPHLDRLADNAREFGAEATAEAATTVLTSIITMLSGLIGEDLAMTLLEEAQRDQ